MAEEFEFDVFLSHNKLKSATCGRGNLRFRDPLNQERRFIPLRLDDLWCTQIH